MTLTQSKLGDSNYILSIQRCIRNHNVTTYRKNPKKDVTSAMKKQEKMSIKNPLIKKKTMPWVFPALLPFQKFAPTLIQNLEF
jgi:hypothetical protein